MTKEAKTKKPEQENLDFKGLNEVVNTFRVKTVLYQMVVDGDLDGWDDAKNEDDFETALANETDLKKIAIYCAVLSNFQEVEI